MMLSIVIVNYNAGNLLHDCLKSIYAGANGMPFEVWVVDNKSVDDSPAKVKSAFPKVRVIENACNVGFSKANNIAVSQCDSNYVLLLNPDTLVMGDAIDRMVDFMEENPTVGIAGCKVLNRDHTLQLACRRSIPTPRVAFFRMTGLSRLFPKNKAMAQYNLTFTDANEVQEVDAVSGAFLMVRRKTIQDIGLLDERFFMYGEELDWCLRAKKAGWKVMYNPGAEIVHYKGESAKYNSRKAAFEFYRAMYLFHKKHFASDHSRFFNFLVYTGILCKSLSSWRSFLFSARVGSSH
jgi:GT2 family glycosyltransferase